MQPAHVARAHLLHDDITVRRSGGDHVRPRLDVVGGHVVRRSVQQSATPLDDDQLGAHPGDVRAHPDEAAREVVHVRLARGVADHRDPLGEDRSHHQVLRAGDGGHVERDARTVQPVRPREVLAVVLLDLGPHETESLEMLLDTAHPDVVTTGFRDAGLACTADEGPEEEERAAHPAAELGVDLGADERCRVQPPRVQVGVLDDDTDMLEHAGHGRDVLDVRHVAELHRLIGEQRRGHDRERGVLAPGDRDSTLEPPPATDAQQFHLRLPYSTAAADRVD